jgi:acetyltransferase
MRFHGGVARLPDALARTMSTQVASRHVALLALDTTGEIAAEARYAVDAEGDAVAEFAVAVGDGWQGRGLGRALLLRLAFHARENGFAALRGSVIPGNEPMLALLRALGAELQVHAAEVHGTIALGG